jgi:hypothetical protein
VRIICLDRLLPAGNSPSLIFGRVAITSRASSRSSGPGYRLTDWRSERTRDCPQKNQAGVTRACGAVMPNLVDLP